MTVPETFSTTFTADTSPGTVTISVSGELDSATVPAFDTTAGQVVDLRPSNVTLDLGAASLIDSTGIGATMRLRRDLLELGATFNVHAPLEFQQRLFTITGLAHILDLHPREG